MKLVDARIGYAGYSPDFAAPGDRRRFGAYAKIKGFPFEYAELNRPYDFAYVTYSSDLPGWIARKRREGARLKLVFELIDSYLTETNLARRLLKGTGRFALGIDSRLSPDLLRTLVEACEAADAVVCSTHEQRETIRRYNPNVFISFDYFADELGPSKTDYHHGGKLKIVWEGQSTTLPNVQVIREPLNDLRDRVELHVVTDPTIHRFFGRLAPYPAMAALKGIECDKHFHRWERGTFSRIVTSCDLAVIPIQQANELSRGKPENKLVLLWKLGMPVLVTPTPVYRRVMEAASIDLICTDASDWKRKLETLVTAAPIDLKQTATRCRNYAESAYSKREFMKRFDDALTSIGID